LALLTPLCSTGVVLISVGDIALLPDMSGQQVDIRIDNAGSLLSVGALEFAIQVADGGPAAGGSFPGPVIDGVDLLTGTVFEGKSFGGQFISDDSTAQQQFWNVLSLTAELPSGTGQHLARVTFDTTGFTQGTWSLSLSGMAFAETRLLDWVGNPIALTIQNGSITVVPEPLVSVSVAGLLLGVAAWRHRRQQGTP
jgi:hypothetical protein